MSWELPSPKKMQHATWYIQHWTNSERAEVSADGSVLKSTCVPKKQGMESGSGFFARPAPHLPALQASLSYEVYIPDNFTWVRGGKFGFGLGIGKKDADQVASGGDWMQDAGSLRTMWRDDGQVIAYVYLPLEGKSRDAVLRAQTDAVQRASEGSIGKDTGMNVWFKIPEQQQLKLEKGAWNTVALKVQLNTPGQTDGILSLTVNGKTKTLNSIKFRKSRDIVLNGVLFHTFFGGSTLEWACKTPQTLSFRNVVVS